MAHEIIKCKICGKIIAQCRCFQCDKKIKYVVCQECSSK